MQANKFYNWSDGKTPAGLISAERLNNNFDNIYNAFNGNIEDDNIKAGAKILVSDRDYTGQDNRITGSFEFATFPIVPDDSIPDAKLSNNVPLKNAANDFVAQQKFSAGLDGDKQEAKNFVVELVASLPGWVTADKGRLLFNITDGKWYGGTNSAWKQLDYIGDYTGGAIRVYSHSGITDEYNSLKFLFKTEGVDPTVKIFLKGEPFPQRFYTELPYHAHVFTGVAHSHGVTDPGHTHDTVIGSHGHGATQYSISTHTHGISGNTGVNNVGHTHGMVNHTHTITHHHSYWKSTEGQYLATGASSAPNTGIPSNNTTAGESASHTHTISLTSGASSANQAIPSANLGTKVSESNTTGISINNATQGGNNAYTGVNIGVELSAVQKLYADTLTVKIDATNITSNILTATGWGEIGNGTGGHTFHTAGTGELDASTWMEYSVGYHTLEILEPVATRGSSISIHIETS